MRPALRNTFFKTFAAVCPLVLTTLTGCGIGVQQLGSTSDDPAPAAHGITITGHAHGGAFPIQGAAITLMETQTAAYGGKGKLLEQVTSDSNGYFTFDNNWTCDAGQYAYVVVYGGHTVATAKTSNNNVIQVGAVGSCSQDLATLTEQNNVNVFVSEPSTIAAAYALGNFISIQDHKVSVQTGTSKYGNPIYTTTDYGEVAEITSPASNNSTSPGCTGSGTAMSCTAAGLAHGFANAYNLVDSVRYDGSFPSGLVRTSVPGNSQSVVPQALINTLGNILQSCVDSNGVTTQSSISATKSDGTACGNLFMDATTPSGTVPSTTLQVALNMAQYPNHNVDALFKLQPTYSFFSPALTTDQISGASTTCTSTSGSGSCMSLSVSIFYEGTGLSGDTGIGTPVHLSLDAQDNVYMVYTGTSGGKTYTAIDGFAANGTGLFLGPKVTGLTNPNMIAIDNAGAYNAKNVWVPAPNAWVTDDTSAGELYQFAIGLNSSGVPNSIGSKTTGYSNAVAVTNGNPAGLAVDLSNNVWVARDSSDTNQSIYEYLSGSSFASAGNFQSCSTTVSNGKSTTTCTGGNPVLSANTQRIFIDAKQDIFGVTSGTSAAQLYVFPYGVLGAGSVVTLSQSTGVSGGLGIAMNSADEAYVPLANELETANAVQGTGDTAVWSLGTASKGLYTTTSGTTSSFGNPGDVALDGAGNVFWTDFEGTGRLFQMVPSTSGSVSNGSGTLAAVYPCFPLNNQCYGTNARLRGMAIDSAGAIWYVADYSPALVIQTLGLAENSWPLVSYAQGGQPVQ